MVQNSPLIFSVSNQMKERTRLRGHRGLGAWVRVPVVAAPGQKLKPEPEELEVVGERLGRHRDPVGGHVHGVLQVPQLLVKLLPRHLEDGGVVANHVPHSVIGKPFGQPLCYDPHLFNTPK